MINIDWNSVMIGAGVGAVASALYFAGLSIGLQRALRSAKPALFLALSSAIRILGLLSLAWFVVAHYGTGAALGYAAAFIAMRMGVVTFVRASGP